MYREFHEYFVSANSEHDVRINPVQNFKTLKNKYKLFYKAWIAEKFTLNKYIVVHHGFGEHSGRYENLIKAFDGTGFSIFIMDVRGHGLSEGKRGHLHSYKNLITDLDNFINHLKTRYKLKDPFLLGHSMGAGIAVSYCLLHPKKVRALICNASPFNVNITKLMRVKLLVGKWINRISPKTTFSAGFRAKDISRDPEVIKKYVTDPLVHGKMAIPMARQLLRGNNLALRNAGDLTLPCLFTHGGADRLSDPAGTLKVYEACASSDKTKIIYDGYRHETYNDLDHEVPLNDLKQWVLSH